MCSFIERFIPKSTFVAYALSFYISSMHFPIFLDAVSNQMILWRLWHGSTDVVMTCISIILFSIPFSSLISSTFSHKLRGTKMAVLHVSSATARPCSLSKSISLEEGTSWGKFGFFEHVVSPSIEPNTFLSNYRIDAFSNAFGDVMFSYPVWSNGKILVCFHTP